MDQRKLNELSARAHSLNFQITVAKAEIDVHKEATANLRLTGIWNRKRLNVGEFNSTLDNLATTLKGMETASIDLLEKLRATIEEIEKELAGTG